MNDRTITARQLVALGDQLLALGDDVYFVRAPIPGNLAIMRDGEQIGHVDWVWQEIRVYSDEEDE